MVVLVFPLLLRRFDPPVMLFGVAPHPSAERCLAPYFVPPAVDFGPVGVCRLRSCGGDQSWQRKPGTPKLTLARWIVRPLSLRSSAFGFVRPCRLRRNFCGLPVRACQQCAQPHWGLGCVVGIGMTLWHLPTHILLQ